MSDARLPWVPCVCESLPGHNHEVSPVSTTVKSAVLFPTRFHNSASSIKARVSWCSQAPGHPSRPVPCMEPVISTRVDHVDPRTLLHIVPPTAPVFNAHPPCVTCESSGLWPVPGKACDYLASTQLVLSPGQLLSAVPLVGILGDAVEDVHLP